MLYVSEPICIFLHVSLLATEIMLPCFGYQALIVLIVLRPLAFSKSNLTTSSSEPVRASLSVW